MGANKVQAASWDSATITCMHLQPDGAVMVQGLTTRFHTPFPRPLPPAEDALLPVLNKRAHLLLDSYNKLRGAVATPLNVSAVVEGQPDPGACLGRCSGHACCGGDMPGGSMCLHGLPLCCTCQAGASRRPVWRVADTQMQNQAWMPRSLQLLTVSAPRSAAAAEVGGKQEAAPAEEAAQSQILIGHLASYQVSQLCSGLGKAEPADRRWGMWMESTAFGTVAIAIAVLLHAAGSSLACTIATARMQPLPQGMGRASVECVSGCTCEPSVLDGWWERHASLQVMHTIRVSQGGLGGGRTRPCRAGLSE